jgi:hypothetical protein
MKILGKQHNQSGKVLGSQLKSGGMFLGSKISSHYHQSQAASSQREHVHRSNLERSHYNIPKDGQFPITHTGGSTRKAWQRKKNH